MATKKPAAKQRPRSPGVTRGHAPDILYTDALADRICEQLADGMSLRAICAQPGMPQKTQVFRWVARYEEFAKAYAAARDAQADALFDELLDVADDKTEDAQSRRVRIDARKWYLSKMRPQKYGEALKLSGDKDAPLMVGVTVLASDADL